MRRLFRMDSPVMSFLSQMCDILWMNILWLLCCLPIFTAGAATAALARMMFDMHDDKKVGTVPFFCAFKNGFRTATALWLILLGLTAVLWGAWSGLPLITGVLHKPVAISLIVSSLLVLILGIYALPMSAYFENTVRNLLKNSIAVGIVSIPATLAAVVLMAVPGLLYIFRYRIFIYFLPMWILLWPGCQAFGITWFQKKVFARYADSQKKSETDSPEVPDEGNKS